MTAIEKFGEFGSFMIRTPALEGVPPTVQLYTSNEECVNYTFKFMDDGTIKQEWSYHAKDGAMIGYTIFDPKEGSKGGIWIGKNH